MLFDAKGQVIKPKTKKRLVPDNPIRLLGVSLILAGMGLRTMLGWTGLDYVLDFIGFYVLGYSAKERDNKCN